MALAWIDREEAVAGLIALSEFGLSCPDEMPEWVASLRGKLAGVLEVHAADRDRGAVSEVPDPEFRVLLEIRVPDHAIVPANEVMERLRRQAQRYGCDVLQAAVVDSRLDGREDGGADPPVDLP